MSSPFPGMDPYLEHPTFWPLLQQYYMTYLADILAEILPRRYMVRMHDRLYTEEAAVEIEQPLRSAPHAGVVCREGACTSSRPVYYNNCGALEEANDISPPWYIPTTPEELRETSIEIGSATRQDTLLTVIEFLSFPNKKVGSLGRQLYRARQKQVLANGAHLLEIDLLRTGAHTILAPHERVLRRGRYHYLAGLSRADAREFCEVWGIPLQERLPRIALPLADNDEDVALDLQKVFEHCYNVGGFARRIDYFADPYLALGRNDAEWAVMCLQQSGVIE